MFIMREDIFYTKSKNIPAFRPAKQ